MAAPKKMKNRLRVSLFIEDATKAKLDRLALKQGRKFAELVREGIDLVLAKYRKAK